MSAVNVNLRPCDCPPSDVPGQRHESACVSGPIPIPCLIPRSVTMTVRLGECTCPPPRLTPASGCHVFTCRAKPVRVACSIGGETWEESEVEDPEGTNQDGRLVGFAFASPVHVACRARWEFVKALVLGRQGFVPPAPDATVELHAQRDAVFAALADMARAEEACLSAEGRLSLKIVGHTLYWPDGTERPSQVALGRYVERLIEQVGAI